MGYYTLFKLEVNGERNLKHEEELCKGYCDRNPFEEPAKWYDFKTDMINYSKEYPDKLFILSGEGQEGVFDYWKFYVKNGKSWLNEATIHYANYYESNLK